MQAKAGSSLPIEDLLDSVVDIHVKTGTDKIIKTVEKESRTQMEHIDTNVDRLVEGQTAVVDALNVVSDSADIKVGIAMEQMKQAQEKADRSERTAREVCGKLGSVERKRRQEDIDNMNRLRNELGVMKRQMRDKDRMVQTLSDRVEALVHQSEDLRRELDERQISNENQIEDLRQEMAERQVAQTTKIDALTNLVRQLINHRS